jgi:PST family polysaccharide transporter
MWATVKWMPRFTFSLDGERSLLAFGLHNSGAALLGQLNARAPEFIIGTFIGPAGVGFYRVGTRAIGMLQDVVITPMQATALSAFSRLGTRDSIGRAYLRLTKACAVVSFPVYFGAAAIAPDFITLCFGAKWMDSGMVMAMLGLAGGAATLAYFSQPTLNALGRSDLAMATSLVTLVSNFAVAIVSVHFGVVWVAFFVTFRSYLSTPFGLYLVRTTTGISGRQFIEGLTAPFISATLMLVTTVGMKYALLQDFHPLLRMAVMIAAGTVVYVTSMLLIGRARLREVRTELRPILLRFGINV